MSYIIRKLLGKKRNDSGAGFDKIGIQEVLNLQPGEWIKVRSEEEILATLDENRRYKGLLWMAGMNKHCGKRYCVFKRLDIMLLESTKEYRKVKNTVLLEGAMCDGKAFNGCGRSCFYFWREAWLQRIDEEDRS